MENYSNTAFLGGTCGDSIWRDKLIPLLNPNVDFFNPQLAPGTWTPEDSVREDACKKAARFNVFGITGDASSAYSFFEIAEELCKNPKRVIFAPLGDLPQISKSSIKVIKQKVLDKGGHVFETLEDLATFLNTEYAMFPNVDDRIRADKIVAAAADEARKKRLYISCPMKGRTEETIRHSMARMHKMAEAVFDQELEVIPTYVKHTPPENANNAVYCLGESIKKMAEADYFIGVDYSVAFKGCEAERVIACLYDIPVHTIPLSMMPDALETEKAAREQFDKDMRGIAESSRY